MSTISRARVSIVQMGKVIRMSERVVKPNQEEPVRQVMDKVRHQIKDWPGMLSVETLVDTQEENRFVVVTEWESRKHMNYWLKSDLCKQIKIDLNKILGEDSETKYRELMHHEDDVFLL